MQTDGKVVVAGTAGYNFVVVRYNSDGSLDASFGIGGQVVTDFGGYDGAGPVVIQPDGRIVVAGHSGSNLALARYTATGALDASLDGDGKRVTDFPGGAQGVALQGDGRIVVASSYAGDMAVVRYNADGSTDTSFGTYAGAAFADFGADDSGYGVAVQTDGKIVVAGNTYDSQYTATSAFAVARFNGTNGSLDTSFHDDGMVTIDGGESSAHDLAIQEDNKLVVAGDFYDPAADVRSIRVFRFNSDGFLDTTYGHGGEVVTQIGDSAAAYSVALDGDGRAVVAGYANNDFALARYTSTGALDPTFGIGGILTTDFGAGSEAVNGVEIAPGGRIVAAGSSLRACLRSREAAG